MVAVGDRIELLDAEHAEYVAGTITKADKTSAVIQLDDGVTVEFDLTVATYRPIRTRKPRLSLAQETAHLVAEKPKKRRSKSKTKALSKPVKQPKEKKVREKSPTKTKATKQAKVEPVHGYFMGTACRGPEQDRTSERGGLHVGDLLKILWTDDAKYYLGLLTRRLTNTSFRILYADGQKETLDLASERFKVVGKVPIGCRIKVWNPETQVFIRGEISSVEEDTIVTVKLLDSEGTMKINMATERCRFEVPGILGKKRRRE